MTISTIRQKTVLVNLDSKVVHKNDKFTVYDKKQTVVAELEVILYNNLRAVTRILSGQLILPVDQYTLADSIETIIKSEASQYHLSTGLLIGIQQNQINIHLSNSKSLSLDGNSYSLDFLLNRQFENNIQISVRIGVDELSGSKSSSICSNVSCNIDLKYLRSEGHLQYTVANLDSVFIAGLGIGIMYPFSKNSNIIEAADIGFSEKIILGIGYQYILNKEYSILADASYATFINNNEVQIFQIGLKAGMIYMF